MEKQFKIVVVADEFHLADSLRDLANLIESDDNPNGFETENAHYTASVNEFE